MTGSGVLVGSENDQKDVSEFWRAVDPLLKAGMTLIISHHMRKANRMGPDSNRDRASGSTDILAGADTTFAVQRPSTRDSVVIECTKSRDAEEPIPFVVSLSDMDADGPVTLRFEGERVYGESQPGKLEHAMQAVEAFLLGAPDRQAQTGEILANARTQGVTEKTAERALEALQKIGRVGSPRRGIWQLVEIPPHAA